MNHILQPLFVMITVVVGLRVLFKSFYMKPVIDNRDAIISELQRKNGYYEKHIENVTARNREAMIGVRVVSRSNEDEPLLIGELVRFEFLSQAKNPFPVVKCEETGKEWVTMGIVFPYSDKMMQELSSMSPKEQWDRLQKTGLRWE
jgi:hypothetical protein